MEKQPPLVPWIIWFALLQGALVIQFVLGKGFPSGDNAAEPMASWLWFACFVPILVATVIRWVVIPRTSEQGKRLVAMIIGLALSENPILFSLFLIGDAYPQNQVAVLIVAFWSMLQFAPIYMKRAE